MSVQHIVGFRFKQGVAVSVQTDLSDAFVKLKQECVLPTTNAPYITKLVGGAQNSPEGLAKGMQNVYLVEFKNVADRDYYVHSDPAHAKFKELAGTLVEDVVVLDFEEGSF